jgi:outer membrane receptor for ferrienterochelin and colicins
VPVGQGRPGALISSFDSPSIVMMLIYSASPSFSLAYWMRKLSARLSATMCLALTVATAADAQDGGPGQSETATPQQTSLQRVEILLRQSATDLRRAASTSKQVYDREDLDRYGDTNVLDVMRRLPGVNVDSGGPKMRGLGAGYTQILLNGDPAPQGFALDQLSPSQVERIEILRAPTADLSTQAIAGTINIILRDAPRRSQRDLQVIVSDGVKRPTASVNFTLSEAKAPLAISLPVSIFEWRRENRVTRERLTIDENDEQAESKQIGAQEVWGHGLNVGPRLNWKLSDDQSLALQSFAQKGWWNNRTEYSSSVISGNPVLEDDSARSGSWQSARGAVVWRDRFRSDQRLELRAGVQDSRWTFDLRSLRHGRERLRTVGDGEERGVTQVGKYSLLMGDSHSLTAGWEFESRRRTERRETTEDGAFQLPDVEGRPYSASIRREALYVQDEWELASNLQFYLGLRLEQISTRTSGTESIDSNSSRVASPILHMTWKIDEVGRELIRASLTRSYKAPPLASLISRPAINSAYTDTRSTNTQLAPDSVGNSALRPELAVGLDVAVEKYVAGGLWAVGVFHRRIDDLVRTITTQQVVPWATVPRWVAQPRNFSSATTSGLELEVKGRASELLPMMFESAKAMNLRASLNLYRSRVAGLPSSDNRLDGQQPWSATFGFDHRLGVIGIGGNVSTIPAYNTQIAADQQQQRSRALTSDFFAQWTPRQGLSVRVALAVGAQPFGPSNGSLRTTTSAGEFSQVENYTRRQLSLSLDLRL